MVKETNKLNEQNFQPRNLYPTKISFKIENGIRTFSIKTQKIVFQQTYIIETLIKSFRWKANDTRCKLRSTGEKMKNTIND